MLDGYELKQIIIELNNLLHKIDEYPDTNKQELEILEYSFTEKVKSILEMYVAAEFKREDIDEYITLLETAIEEPSDANINSFIQYSIDQQITNTHQELNHAIDESIRAHAADDSNSTIALELFIISLTELTTGKTVIDAEQALNTLSSENITDVITKLNENIQRATIKNKSVNPNYNIEKISDLKESLEKKIQQNANLRESLEEKVKQSYDLKEALAKKVEPSHTKPRM